MSTQTIEIPEDQIQVISPEEVDELIWTELQSWMNGNTTLPPHVKEAFLERNRELRLRMQAIFMEIQKRYLSIIAQDIEFEQELRDMIRENIPFMSAKEKMESHRGLEAINETRLHRLETQMAGFDFFNTVESAIQTLSETTVSKELTIAVKSLPSVKRQNLLNMLNSMVEDIEKEENGSTTNNIS